MATVRLLLLVATTITMVFARVSAEEHGSSLPSGVLPLVDPTLPGASSPPIESSPPDAWTLPDAVAPADSEATGDLGDVDHLGSDWAAFAPVLYQPPAPALSSPVPAFSNSTVPCTADSLGQYQLDGVGTPSALSLNNNFNTDPEFARGIVIVGRGVAMKIGGYVKADLITDFNAIDSTDSFDTTSIPTSGPQRENVRFHARQSRLSFDTRWLICGDTAKAFVEADFFGRGANGNDAFRLRHAYGQFGRFTAGQTWTTFTDPSAVPATLDFEGAVSNVNRRQGLVRWTEPVWVDGLSVAFALEDPRTTVEGPSLQDGNGRTSTPDFITRLRYDRDWAEFQGALVLREIGFQPTGGPVIEGNAWGFNFTGSFLLTEQSKTYYQITFGEGIGSYRGSPDIVSTGPNLAAVQPVFGWMIGYKREWTDRLSSNFTVSKLSLDAVPGVDPDSLRRTTYLAVNLINNPYERIFWGVEYLYGVRQDVSGAKGSANRLQCSFGFYLP